MRRRITRRDLLRTGVAAAGAAAALGGGLTSLEAASPASRRRLLQRRRRLERERQREAAASADAEDDPRKEGRAEAEPAKFDPPYAICNETFTDSPFDEAFRVAAECGYQGLEVAPFTLADDVREVSAERRRAIRRQSETAGVKVIGLHWLLARTKGIHLTSPDAAVRAETASYLGALADFCADLGGDLLVFGSPKQRNLMPGVSRGQGMQYAADVVAQALPRLEKAGVRLAFEPLSPGTTNFLQTAADAVELVERIDSPRVRMILDCNAMATEKASIPELIRKYHRYMVHFHANDPNKQGPGFGELDFVPIFQALRDVEFDGWVSVEVFDYSPGAERLARESIEYMRKCVERTTAG